MLSEIKNEEIFTICKSNLSNISNKEWENIDTYKHTYILNPSKLSNSYPGFYFSDKHAAVQYDKFVHSWYKYKLNAFTLPRGNLTKENNVFVVGFKPGHFQAHKSISESAWLLGPSSKMLIKLFDDIGVYPYFTNFYHSYFVENNKDDHNILSELLNIFTIYLHVYNKRSFIILFLGSSYEEFDILSNKLNYEGLDIKIKKIWHPSYILRNQNEETYNIWKGKLNESLCN